METPRQNGTPSKQEHRGVVIAITKEWIRYMDTYTTLNSRMMRITFNTKPLRLTIIAAYAPHSRLNHAVKDKFYDQLAGINKEHGRK